MKVLIWRDLIRSLGRSRKGPRRRLPKAMVNSLEWDRLRNRMPPEHMDLWARILKINGEQRLPLRLSSPRMPG